MRVFQVTLTREMNCTIAAENEAELEKALENLDTWDFDDWNPPDWEWSIYDPLKRVLTSKDAERFPNHLKKPDMAVKDEEILSIEDVGATKVMDQVEVTIREHKQKILLAEVQARLPGID